MRTVLNRFLAFSLLVFSILPLWAQPSPEKGQNEADRPCWNCVKCQSMFTAGQICCTCPKEPSCECFIFTSSCNCSGGATSTLPVTTHESEMKPLTVTMDAKQEANTRDFEAFLSTQRSPNLIDLASVIKSARENLRSGRLDTYDILAHKINNTVQNLQGTDKTLVFDWLTTRGYAAKE